jgi:hypothetical protein
MVNHYDASSDYAIHVHEHGNNNDNNNSQHQCDIVARVNIVDIPPNVESIVLSGIRKGGRQKSVVGRRM